MTRGVRALVVDDEPLVARMVKLLLELRGMAVQTIPSGEEALEHLEAHAGDVDLVFLDLTMAGMDGAEVLARMAERGLAVPVIVSSGYLPDGVEPEAIYGHVAAFLPKPYSEAELDTAIDAALAAD